MFVVSVEMLTDPSRDFLTYRRKAAAWHHYEEAQQPSERYPAGSVYGGPPEGAQPHLKRVLRGYEITDGPA